jgi:hypothetical protein
MKRDGEDKTEYSSSAQNQGQEQIARRIKVCCSSRRTSIAVLQQDTSMDTGASKSSMETSQATREHYIHVDRRMMMIFSSHLMQATSELMKKRWYTLSRGSAILVA